MDKLLHFSFLMNYLLQGQKLLVLAHQHNLIRFRYFSHTFPRWLISLSKRISCDIFWHRSYLLTSFLRRKFPVTLGMMAS